MPACSVFLLATTHPFFYLESSSPYPPVMGIPERDEDYERVRIDNQYPNQILCWYGYKHPYLPYPLCHCSYQKP